MIIIRDIKHVRNMNLKYIQKQTPTHTQTIKWKTHTSMINTVKKKAN